MSGRFGTMVRMATSIASGVVHALPADMRAALAKSKKALEAWNDNTPLARNEWICWTISVKKAETRKEHLDRMIEDLQAGKRRPCCWMGCVHRKDKAVNKSQKWVMSRNARR